MGGRLLDFLAQGLHADRPLAASVPAAIVPGGLAFYFSNDTGAEQFNLFNEDTADWYTIPLSAFSAPSFAALTDVDWTTPPADGEIFVWDAGSSKLIPSPYVPGNTTEQIQDIVGAMLVGITGITAFYDDPLGQLQFTVTVTQYTDEMAVDALGAAFALGTHIGCDVIYDDINNKISVEVDVAWVDGLIVTAISMASIDDLNDVDTSTTPPADGDVLTWSAANSAWEPAAPGVGSGSGQPWYWDPPTAASLTAVSYNATLPLLTDDADVGLIFDYNEAQPAGDEIKAAWMAAPGGWAQVEAIPEDMCVNLNFNTNGIILWNSANNRCIVWGNVRSGFNAIASRANFTPGGGAGASSWNANLAAATPVLRTTPFYRVRVSGTNLLFEFSYNGKKWFLFATEALATWIVAVTHIGIGMIANVGSSYVPNIVVPRFVIT